MAKYPYWIWLLLLTGILLISGCSSQSSAAAGPKTTGLSESETSNDAFKSLFPLQYNSYEKNKQMEDTKYGGSVNRSKFDSDKEPLLPILFNGYTFATDYNEDRGHLYALQDIRKTERISEKSVGSCYTCKSTVVPKLISQMGDKYWGTPFNDIWKKGEAMGHSPIGCSDCHDPKTMDLRVTRPMLFTALKGMGVDVSKPTKNEMRSYVCGQCHVEYYFAPNSSQVTLPWSKGFEPSQMYDYYSTIAKNSGFEKDYISNISGAPILKAQHPDFETFMSGPHGKAGVSCADCHMPYERVDGKKKISSHWWTSPLKTMQTSCGQCHADRNLDELKKEVIKTQDTTMQALHDAENTSANAHYYVNKMITSGADPQKVKQAQDYVRQGQWFWDIVAAENSAGFHNPQGSVDSLRTSIDNSNKAIQLATEELVKKGVNIEELNNQIEKAKQAVQNEKVNDKKKNNAINTYFLPQAPVKK